jgi:hypothetical protein
MNNFLSHQFFIETQIEMFVLQFELYFYSSFKNNSQLEIFTKIFKKFYSKIRL